jgi:hypothetical protein
MFLATVSNSVPEISLEANTKKGKKERAIGFYQKVLKLDPANTNIRKIIDTLKKK